jgi:putative FmdB family regulatory protein
MPLYEYTCRKCHSDFELLIRSDETPECPGCGSRKLEKHLSVAAAHTASGSNPLPICGAPSMAACGRPECGMGRCAFE